ncbi:MAG: UvrD-helicase domain-containing protein [Pseudomonadales bacterium]|jgi:ATP-dependent DNA helicase Rep|nr:UvrD-helicase domain-containing protein [Pseudomonadales bacterium]
MTSLNSRQLHAVRYIDGPLLVLAGAGSGKTSVITRKIAWLITECGYQPHNIAALTFTNKAAREMRERVQSLLKDVSTRGLTISTFHHLGLTMIRRECAQLGLKSSFSIFDETDCLSLLKELLLKDVDVNDEQLRKLASLISQWKNRFLMPEAALREAQDAEQELAARLYEGYQRSLKAFNAVDFDDLILLPAQLFRTAPEILEKWRRHIRYLLVDEYQDTNHMQYEFVKLLVGERGALTVVGDDDQSIYSWRGAQPENMQLLQQDFPNLHVIKLEQNYRSTNTILTAANALIANNAHVFEKTLWSEYGQGDPIRVLVCANEEAEVERIATEILLLTAQRRLQFRDFAVLYRGNHQARLLEIQLQAHQIPYQITGGTSFFARTEIKDLMAYLKLLINPDDDNSFLRCINTPRRKIGPSILEGLGHYAAKAGVSMLAACTHLGVGEYLNEGQRDKLREFALWLEQKREHMDKGGGVPLIRELIDDIHYDAWLQQNAATPKAAERAAGNVQALLSSLESSLTRAREHDEDATLETAINKLILRDLLEQQAEAEETNKVQLMTLHAAKGLEFPVVFIMGMEEDILPHRNSLELGDIAEERRLAYVGITRAQRQLLFTLAHKRKQYGEMTQTTPSRFLDELPPALLAWDGRAVDQTPEKAQERGRETLSRLKSLFD